MIRTERKVSVISQSGSQFGTCVYEQYGKWDGIKFGLAVLFSIWLVTLPTILIPLVHFMTVPTGFFGGLVFAFIAFKNRRNKQTISNGNSVCQKCLCTLSFSFPNASGSLDGVCPKCGSCFQVEFVSEDSVSPTEYARAVQ